MANENSSLNSAKRNKKDEFYTQLVRRVRAICPNQRYVKLWRPVQKTINPIYIQDDIEEARRKRRRHTLTYVEKHSDAADDDRA
jgi:hypothetical protein